MTMNQEVESKWLLASFSMLTPATVNVPDWSKNTCRMIGLLTMLLSVFLLIGGLYLGPAGVLPLVPHICLIAGLALLVVGVVFYRIMKSE